MNNIILIIIPIAIALILIIIGVVVILGSKNKEAEPSILDVDMNGVSDDKDFSYGYEKEETVVMDPVEVPKEELESKTEIFTPEEIDAIEEAKEETKDN